MLSPPPFFLYPSSGHSNISDFWREIHFKKILITVFYVLKKEIFAESLATDGRSKMDIVHAIVIAMKILLNM